MLIEARVAVSAGRRAGSRALTSFGFDSVIELVSATLALGRLHLTSRSPLSNLEELELLRLGVEGKAAGWRTLRVLACTDVVAAGGPAAR
jgi:hypothetical protein